MKKIIFLLCFCLITVAGFSQEQNSETENTQEQPQNFSINFEDLMTQDIDIYSSKISELKEKELEEKQKEQQEIKQEITDNSSEILEQKETEIEQKKQELEETKQIIKQEEIGEISYPWIRIFIGILLLTIMYKAVVLVSKK